MPPRVPDEHLDFTRRLRRNLSTAETILWRALRGRAIGAKFRRQVPVGPYVADFACVAVRLIVELDGPSHDTLERQVGDKLRDAWFAEHGWRVVRVPNDLVTNAGASVMDKIKTMLRESPHPTLADARATFSRTAGEGMPRSLDDHS